MNEKKIFWTTVLLCIITVSVFSQNNNPNLITGAAGVSFEASSVFPVPPWMAPPYNIAK